jgi:hypothetical protein
MVQLFKNNKILKIKLLSTRCIIKKLKIKKLIQNIIHTDLIKKSSANFSLQFPGIFKKKLTAPGKPIRGYEKYFNNKEIKFKTGFQCDNSKDLENIYLLEKNLQLLNVKKFRECISKNFLKDSEKYLGDFSDEITLKTFKSLNPGFDYSGVGGFIKGKKNENNTIVWPLKKTINIKNADTSLDAYNHTLFLKKNI